MLLCLLCFFNSFVNVIKLFGMNECDAGIPKKKF